MKKRSFKVAVLIFLTFSLVMSSMIGAFADENDAVKVLLNEDMLNERPDVFTTNVTGAGVAYEEGKLVLTADSSTNSMFDLTGIDLGLGSVSEYTISADIRFTTFATNALAQFGVRTNPNNTKWGAGTLIQCQYASNGLKHQEINKEFVSGSNAAKVNKYTSAAIITSCPFVSIADPSVSNIFNVAIKFGSETVTFYVNGGEMWTQNTADCGNKAGHLFFGLRSGHILEVDNLLIYTGTGDAPATNESKSEGAPWGLGYQLSDVYASNGAKVSNIRFVAVGKDMTVDEVGFTVTANVEGKSWDRHTTTVYGSLLGRETPESAPSVVATAEEYGAEYIYGLAIMEIPTDTPIVFTVTPYAIKGSERVIGASFQVSVNIPSENNG